MNKELQCRCEAKKPQWAVGPHWFDVVRESGSSVLKSLLSGVMGSIKHLLVTQKILCLQHSSYEVRILYVPVSFCFFE